MASLTLPADVGRNDVKQSLASSAISSA